MRCNRVVVLALCLAACGGEDGAGRDSQTDKGRRYADAMVAELEADEEFPFSGEEARCMSEGMVDIMGVDALEEAGVEPEDLADSQALTGEYEATDEEVDRLVDTMFECADWGALVVQGADISLPAEKVECLGEEVERSEELRDALRAEIAGADAEELDDEASAALGLQWLEACDVELSELLGGG